jgi:hypothetical protein
MIEVQLAAGGSRNDTGHFYGYRIIVPSAAGTIRLNNGVVRPIFGCDYFLCRQGIDAAGNRYFVPWQSIQVAAGPGAPVYVRVAESEEDVQALGAANLQPAMQEGDTIPPALGGVNPGPFGMVSLFRDPSGLLFRIPPAVQTNAGVGLVMSQPICSAVFDGSSGAGAAFDTGAITYTSTDSSLFVEVAAAAALTGSRTVDVRKVRPDGTQYSLFDPVRNTAATYSLGIGRTNYLAVLGMAVSGLSSAVGGQDSLDHVWGFPLELGGIAGIRIVLTAGGAEVVRVRIIERRNSAL